jgi:hypothetical protein
MSCKAVKGSGGARIAPITLACPSTAPQQDVGELLSWRPGRQPTCKVARSLVLSVDTTSDLLGQRMHRPLGRATTSHQCGNSNILRAAVKWNTVQLLTERMKIGDSGHERVVTLQAVARTGQGREQNVW